MKLLLCLFVTGTVSFSSFGQASREQDFVKTMKAVVNALATRDSVTLSKYIDKKQGVYILARIGIVDHYSHYSTLGFSDSTYPNIPFYDDVKLTPLKYETLPTYDCEKWTKTGTFVDTTKVDHLLSRVAREMSKHIQKPVPQKTIREFSALEDRSRRIVIAEDEGNELIFYLTYNNNKWVLTIIDKVTCDCST